MEKYKRFRISFIAKHVYTHVICLSESRSRTEKSIDSAGIHLIKINSKLVIIKRIDNKLYIYICYVYFFTHSHSQW